MFDLFGPTVQFLTAEEADDSGPCILRGVIPPGGFVPLHSHGDPETFIVASGKIEVFSSSAAGMRWIQLGPGDIFHIPGDTRHAWRNRSSGPGIAIVVTTPKLGRFLREVGRPVAREGQPPAAPTGEQIQHFLTTSQTYGYWNATPEENAEIGG
ncbi:MAG: cupin domain-containing protein [Acetobacteraceae bacterium]|nr:cupin domain-containing protein [Acetobacteraceae bacterium]